MAECRPFTVIVPAHNEEAVIERCLMALGSRLPRANSMQLIVAANGCTDSTVRKVKEVAPQALVLDLPQGSKSAAMNEANKHALHFPRIYVDADVQCSFTSLSALAMALHKPGVMAASPAIKMDLTRSNSLVRAYYRVWLTQPYASRSMVGSGCYGISEAGYERIGDFPLITGDDIWVHSRFTEEERSNIAHDDEGNAVYFTVSPPRKAVDQIRVETRRRLGNQELLANHPSPHFTHSNSASDLRHALASGASIPDVLVYLGIKMIVRVRAKFKRVRQHEIVWERDLAAREIS